jgi:hypothetical protein
MTLRVVLAWDDDIDKAGNLLAASDFLDGDDGEVDAVEGVNPTLDNIIVYENDDSRADATNIRARGTFQMNTWPNTKRLTMFGARAGGLIDSEAATQQGGSGTDTLYVKNELNMSVQAGDNWISDNSYLYASQDNAAVLAAMFVYSYGQRYPYRGGHMQWIRKVADAAETGADAMYQAWATQLTGVAPGLDPKKQYVLRGVVHEAAASAKAAIGAIVQPQASAFKLVGPSWLDFGMCQTIYLDDGIPCIGSDGFVAKTGSATAADTPYVWLGFEEYGSPSMADLKKGTFSKPAGASANKIGGTLSGLLGGLAGNRR